MNYDEFLASKARAAERAGRDVAATDVHAHLHRWQAEIVQWAVGIGRAAKDNNDEKHIAPLQLDFIERCVRLWSNPGELVLSPFMGIGSEGYVSIQQGRRFVGCELKPSYWRQAVQNLRAAEAAATAPTLFGGAA